MKQLGIGLLILLFLGVTLCATWPWWRRLLASEAYRDISPDQRYAMVVFREPMLFSAIGGGSDAPGYVQLQDARGRVLQEAPLEMIQLAHPIEWSAQSVEIPVVAGPWPLP